MVQNILICDFPHCGTSILKSIIGHIDNVYEEIEECEQPRQIKDPKYKFTLCKMPYTYKKYFTSQFDGFIKIMIIRNPIYVFSSINRRHSNLSKTTNHTLQDYLDTIRMFREKRKSNDDKVYCIKYEELFENNHERLKNILKDIGLIFDDKIFDNKLYENKIHTAM